MLIVVIGILSLILAFDAPPFPLVTNPAAVIAIAALATLIPPVIAALTCRKALRLLDRNPADPGHGQYVHGQGSVFVQWSTGALQAALLCGTDWLGLCVATPVVGHWPMAQGLLAGLPLLISIFLSWVALYPSDRAIREIAVEVFLFRGRPTQPVWSLRRFLMYNFRHQVLIVLVPMLIILMARDVIQMYRRPIRMALGHPFTPDLLLGVVAVGVALFAPVLLRHIWVTASLPAGPLRDHLQRLCKKLRMRCRDILVWKSGGMIINAAVMGVVAPLRYVLITDGMLEQMEDRKIEAVFGHEAGHVKRHHILFFLLFAFISGCLLTVFTHGLRADERPWRLAIIAVVFMFKWGVLFGWVSRKFERQADIYGVRTLALAGLPCEVPCAMHHPSTESKSGDPLCQSAAHLFSATLNDVAVLNNIPPSAWSWRHGSIASRSRVLQQYAADPVATQRFERGVWWIKVTIFVIAVSSGLAAVWELRLWEVVRRWIS